jgi:hypothetical protein
MRSEIVFSADQWIRLLDTVSFIVNLSSLSARDARAVYCGFGNHRLKLVRLLALKER